MVKNCAVFNARKSSRLLLLLDVEQRLFRSVRAAPEEAHSLDGAGRELGRGI
jgi:hypothetical protein